MKSKIYLLLILGAFGCAKKELQTANEENASVITLSKKQQEQLGLKLGTLEQVALPVYVSLRGMIDVPPSQRVSVSVTYGGFVHDLDLLPGQKVMKGERLFTLQNPEFLDMQRAYLEQMQRVKFLETDYERQRSLAKDSIASQKKLQQIQAEYEASKYSLQALAEQLNILGVSLSELRAGKLTSTVAVKSPITGFVGGIQINEGSFLTPQDIAMEIVNDSHKHLELVAYEKDFSKLKLGQPILFSVIGSKKRRQAEVYLTEKSVDPKDRTLRVHAHFTDDDPSLVVGRYVEADVEVSNEKVWALPAGSVVDLDGKNYIIISTSVNDSTATFEQVEVQKGPQNEEWVAIENADFIKEKTIVIEGAFDLIK